LDEANTEFLKQDKQLGPTRKLERSLSCFKNSVLASSERPQATQAGYMFHLLDTDENIRADGHGNSVSHNK